MQKSIRILLLLLMVGAQAAAQEARLEEGLALKYLAQPPHIKSKHPPVIILLHGYGSDEKDLFGLKDKLPGRFLIVSARAPYALPGGGYEWYEFSTANGTQAARKDQVSNSRMLIQKFVAEITAKYKADPKQVYLIGFSQGAVMSYEAGLTDPDLIRGIAVLSGRILPDVQRGIAHKEKVKKMKIFIAHGTADDRIKFEEGKAAVDFLKRLGAEPEFHDYAGMSHTISNDVLKDLVKWLSAP